MTLVQGPIGVSAVSAFYSPLTLVEGEIPWKGGLQKITCHKKAWPQIFAFFSEVKDRGLSDLLHDWDGCYDPRGKRKNPSSPSMHSRGAAFDINSSTNAQGDPNGNISPLIVQVGDDLGFFWGGRFRGEYVDKMHFQLGTDFALDGRPIPKVSQAMLTKYGGSAGTVAVGSGTKVFHKDHVTPMGFAPESVILVNNMWYVRASTVLPLLGADFTPPTAPGVAAIVRV